MQLFEFQGDRFIAVLKSKYQILSICAFIVCYEGDCVSLNTSSACPSNSVNVIFQVVGAEVVDDESYMANIQASCTQASRYHDIPNFVLEVQDKALSVNLVLTTMQHNCLISSFVKLFKEVISLDLLINKDEHRSFILPLS